MNYEEIAQKHGTPYYIYNFNKIQDEIQKFKTALRGNKSLITYAVKANPNLSILKYIESFGLGADCVSINEVKRALEAGIQPYKIVFSGVGKSKKELEEAINLNILYINVESEEELLEIEKIARDLNKPARVSLRINPNINAKTHPYISTGLKENKFGINIEEAKKLYIHIYSSKYLKGIGLQFHIGSQIFDLKAIVDSTKIAYNLLKSLLALGLEIKFFSVGGGLGVSYDNEKEITFDEYYLAIKKIIKGYDGTIIFEPGRRIVAKSGELVTKVLYTKKNQDISFAIVDAGMNDFMRSTLYGAYHKIETITHKSGKNEKVNIVGPICESSDFFCKNRLLPKITSGVLLKICDVGAYGSSMGSRYNSRPNIIELAYQNDEVRIIRERENFADLINKEIDYI